MSPLTYEEVNVNIYDHSRDLSLNLCRISRKGQTFPRSDHVGRSGKVRLEMSLAISAPSRSSGEYKNSSDHVTLMVTGPRENTHCLDFVSKVYNSAFMSADSKRESRQPKFETVHIADEKSLQNMTS
ncbi:hypothetical protein J6590_020349 [Homalodisca vitripennis]|nr:hypothetical protein J6590_020349 [Homalodisca vitripennis]